MTTPRPALLVGLAAALLVSAAPAAAVEVLLIPDSIHRTVHKFDPATGEHLGMFLGPDETHLTTPIDCAVNATGILISDQDRGAVLQYDTQGGFVRTFVSGIENIHGIVARDGRLHCTAYQDYAIPTFDLDSGTPIGYFVPPGRADLFGPSDILFRTEGDVLVSPGIVGPPGVAQLNGNILATNSTGVFEIDRETGAVVSTKLRGIGGQFIRKVDLAVGTPIEPSTWGGIKAQYGN